MRLFIAINFSAATKNALLGLRDELRGCSESGNFTLPENLHLTLSFLGECSARQASAAKSAMDAVSFEAFDASIERIGRFGRGEGESLWFAALRETKPLLDFQRDLADELSASGFDLDRRKFSPHITLGRRVITTAVPRRIEPFGETVRKIDLMDSGRIGGKLTYTAIYSTNCT
ncbi:MAG: RNA 2',3'-cyclic phosphodiesterase [Oscillospiraceae bacterium]|jgi:2'-5' RNA ligase|nr:RNA 2',3'-cyclic phosphodiesterase [Oscillospiraceae bacterium]